MSLWFDYVEATKNRKPIRYIDAALKLLPDEHGKALDLGCGAGVDAKYLAEHGFAVTAIDSDEAAVASTKELCKNLAVSITREDLAGISLPENTFQLIICFYIIPFLESSSVLTLLEKIQKALAPGGVFIFGFVGPEDDWRKNGSAKTFLTAEEFQREIPQMKMASLQEIKGPGSTATHVNKFWHKIEGLAQKG